MSLGIRTRVAQVLVLLAMASSLAATAAAAAAAGGQALQQHPQQQQQQQRRQQQQDEQPCSSSASTQQQQQPQAPLLSLQKQLLHVPRLAASLTAPLWRHQRRLLHLDAADTAEVAEAGVAAQGYPREAAAVQRFLLDALRSPQAPLLVPVWFAIVTDARSPPAANITLAQVQQQVQLLNRAYATGLPGGQQSQLWRFRLMGVLYVSSSDGPMCMGSRADARIKAELHPQLAGGAGGGVADRTLIVYTSDLASPACKGAVAGYRALFGWSNTPVELAEWKERGEEYKDGVVMDFRYLFGGGGSSSVVAEAGASAAAVKAMHGAATGAQLVHEVGHFLGLLHTFVGGCSPAAGTTDAVDDTPAEAHPRQWAGVDLGDASGGCQPRDTCPGLPGDDPVDNYMTYNNLACARRFTPGQQARMLFAFQRYRSGTTT